MNAEKNLIQINGFWRRCWRTWYRRALPAYWIFLFCVTHFPELDLSGAPVPSDKFVHFVAFAILAFLYWRFVESFDRPLDGRFFWGALVILSAYAAIDEYLQEFVGRSADLGDWLANVTGIAAVLAILEALRRLAQVRLKRRLPDIQSRDTSIPQDAIASQGQIPEHG